MEGSPAPPLGSTASSEWFANVDGAAVSLVPPTRGAACGATVVSVSAAV